MKFKAILRGIKIAANIGAMTGLPGADLVSTGLSIEQKVERTIADPTDPKNLRALRDMAKEIESLKVMLGKK